MSVQNPPYVTYLFEPTAQQEAITLDNVVETILRLAQYDEVELLKLASENRLSEVIPYRVKQDTAEPLLDDWEQVQEAPARRLTDAEFRKFLKDR